MYNAKWHISQTKFSERVVFRIHNIKWCWVKIAILQTLVKWYSDIKVLQDKFNLIVYFCKISESPVTSLYSVSFWEPLVAIGSIGQCFVVSSNIWLWRLFTVRRVSFCGDRFLLIFWHIEIHVPEGWVQVMIYMCLTGQWLVFLKQNIHWTSI